jgi:hypothetical protein
MTDEHLSYRTSLNSRDDYNINVGLYGESHGGNDGQEDNVATPEVHQHGEDVLPLPTLYQDKMEEGHRWSFKDHGNSMRAPIARGANVQSVCNATC